MASVWIQRVALAALILAFVGCAATVPKEPIRLSGLPRQGAEIVRIQDARKTDAQAGDTVQMSGGQGTRIPAHMITPEALQVFNAFLQEYLESQSVKPMTEAFAVSRLDIAILKGKAPPVGASPGAEGYAGYLGAAIGKMMAQAYENSKVPDYVQASLRMTSSSRELIWEGSYSIYNGDTGEATLTALRNAAYQCGFQFLLRRE